MNMQLFKVRAGNMYVGVISVCAGSHVFINRDHNVTSSYQAISHVKNYKRLRLERITHAFGHLIQ